MEIITIYAVISQYNNRLISTTKNKEHAIETCYILNTVNKTSQYKVIPCNGLISKNNESQLLNDK